MSTLTLAQSANEDLLQVQVLGVYWIHDDLASEQGYGLHYRGQGSVSGVTLLADERSERDAPLYLGDWVRLRGIGCRRHALVDNLTHLRAADAVQVDWAQIALQPPVAPAQLFDMDLPELSTRSAQERAVEKLKDQQAARYAERHPDVARFIDRIATHGATRIKPSEAVLRATFTNGGW